MIEEMQALQPQVIEATALEQLTRGEVDMQVATAKRWPRSLQAFKQGALAMAVKTPAIAASCFYVIPRGGKKIEGPSIRLAEIVGVTWGNLRCEARVIGDDGKQVTAQATAWDMQSNYLIRKECQRKIVSANGKRYTDDMVIMTGNAAASIALRNAIFSVVPFAYVSEIYEHCRMVAAGDRGSLDDARKQWLGVFGGMGIEKAQVLELLEKNGVADIDIDDISTLQGLKTALDDGDTTIGDVFGPATLKDGTAKFGFKARQEKKAEAAERDPGADDA